MTQSIAMKSARGDIADWIRYKRQSRYHGGHRHAHGQIENGAIAAVRPYCLVGSMMPDRKPIPWPTMSLIAMRGSTD